jgi:hypothetical protein
MAINLPSVAAHIHSCGADRLTGLYIAVRAKCEALGISPGRRESGITPAGGGENVNGRGVLQFVESVEPITDEDTKPGPGEAFEEVGGGDPFDVIVAKNDKKNAALQRTKEREARLAAKREAQAALLKLYVTLRSRFSSAGFKEPEKPQAEAAAPVDPPALTG